MIQRCVRCGAPSATVMSYDYAERAIWLEDLRVAVEPGIGYPLCTPHADRLGPPVGWVLSDRRLERPLFTVPEVV